jgi:hypothetical protein
MDLVSRARLHEELPSEPEAGCPATGEGRTEEELVTYFIAMACFVIAYEVWRAAEHLWYIVLELRELRKVLSR